MTNSRYLSYRYKTHLPNSCDIAYDAGRMKQNGRDACIDTLISWIGSVPSLVVHTVVFAFAFALGILRVGSWELILLVLTTVVSLEAIYLAILIQITVNRHTASLREVEQNIDEIQEDVEELGEDMEEMQEDIEEISEEETGRDKQTAVLDRLEADLERVLASIEALKSQEKSGGLSAPSIPSPPDKRERKR